MHPQLHWLALLLLLATVACRENTIPLAEVGTLVGTVISENSEQAVSGVEISTNPPTNSVFTDSLGQFLLADIEVGSFSLRAEKEGFAPKVESINVLRNQTTNVILRLEPDSLANTPPAVPFNPSPADNATGLGTEVVLRWESDDSDAGDELTYTVTLYNADLTDPTVVLDNRPVDTVRLDDLSYDALYLWQVTVMDGIAEVNGPVYSFRTAPFPDNRYHFVRAPAGEFDVFASDAAGNAFQLTDNGASNWRPRMDPFRNKIAYLSNTGLTTQLYVMNRDGSNVQQVSNGVPVVGSDPLELDFCWSPDAAHLLYMNGGKLYRVRSNGTELTLLAQAPTGFTFTEVDWNGPTNRIAARVTGEFPYESIIYLLDENGTITDQVVGDQPGRTGGPMFSIDGRYLLYNHDVSGFDSPDGRRLDSRLFLLDLDNPTLPAVDLSEDLKPAGTNDLDARFSPTGASVIFVNAENDDLGAPAIYEMDLDGLSRTLLFDGATMPDWR